MLLSVFQQFSQGMVEGGGVCGAIVETDDGCKNREDGSGSKSVCVID